MAAAVTGLRRPGRPQRGEGDGEGPGRTPAGCGRSRGRAWAWTTSTCRPRPPRVSSSSTPPRRARSATAEHALGLMYALARKIPAADAHVKAGGFKKNLFTGTQLAGKTLGRRRPRAHRPDRRGPGAGDGHDRPRLRPLLQGRRRPRRQGQARPRLRRVPGQARRHHLPRPRRRRHAAPPRPPPPLRGRQARRCWSSTTPAARSSTSSPWRTRSRRTGSPGPRSTSSRRSRSPSDHPLLVVRERRADAAPRGQHRRGPRRRSAWRRAGRWWPTSSAARSWGR